MNHRKGFKLLLVLFLALSAGLKAQLAQPTQAEIDGSIMAAEASGRIVPITSAGLNVPTMLKEVTSLPVVFRTTMSEVNYDIVVIKMAFTPTGSELVMGSRFTPPNSTALLYFGSNTIAVSAKHGFAGTMPILSSSLSDAKSAEIDDPDATLGGQTLFAELPLTNFRGNATLGLSQRTNLSFECGEFIKFNISGYLKVFNQVVKENPDGTSIADTKPLMLFFNNKDITDWQDIYIPATVSRGFHASQYEDLGFQFLSTAKIYIDLSKKQSPKDLPTCATTEGNNWQGVVFEEFKARLPANTDL